MVSIQHRHHYVYVLFATSIMMSDALKYENNKIKRKFAFISVNTINIFIPCNENTQICTRANTDVFITRNKNIYGIHSKRANMLYFFIA